MFPMRYLFKNPTSGFSFLEIMIVLAIIGLFTVFGTRKMMNSSTQMKSSVRRFSTMVKKIRNKAKIQNKTFRLVFNLPKEKEKKQSYWIESTAKQALLLSEEELEELSEELEDSKTGDDKKKKEQDPQGFVTNKQIIRKPPAVLPEGLFFESIEIDGDPVEIVKNGQVYIHFFPNGYVQSSAIHLSNREELHWTLSIHGLTGRVNIFPMERSLKEIKEQEKK